MATCVLISEFSYVDK